MHTRSLPNARSQHPSRVGQPRQGNPDNNTNKDTLPRTEISRASPPVRMWAPLPIAAATDTVLKHWTACVQPRRGAWWSPAATPPRWAGCARAPTPSTRTCTCWRRRRRRRRGARLAACAGSRCRQVRWVCCNSARVSVCMQSLLKARSLLGSEWYSLKCVYLPAVDAVCMQSAAPTTTQCL